MEKIPVKTQPAQPGDLQEIGNLYEELYTCMAALQADKARVSSAA